MPRTGAATPVLTSNETWRRPGFPRFVSMMTTPLLAREP